MRKVIFWQTLAESGSKKSGKEAESESFFGDRRFQPKLNIIDKIKTGGPGRSRLALFRKLFELRVRVKLQGFFLTSAQAVLNARRDALAYFWTSPFLHSTLFLAIP